MGGDDDRSTQLLTGFDDSPLDDGQLLIVALYSQITSSHHDHIGCSGDGIEMVDRELMLNFGNDLRLVGGGVLFQKGPQ